MDPPSCISKASTTQLQTPFDNWTMDPSKRTGRLWWLLPNVGVTIPPAKKKVHHYPHTHRNPWTESINKRNSRSTKAQKHNTKADKHGYNIQLLENMGTKGHKGKDTHIHQKQPYFDKSSATVRTLVNRTWFSRYPRSQHTYMTTEVNLNFTSRPSVIHMVWSVSQPVSKILKRMQYLSMCIKQSWRCSAHLKSIWQMLSMRVK
jgi:hypothetical protein